MAGIRTCIGNRMTISLLLTALRVVIGTVLLFSGIAKLASFSVFVNAVFSYQMLPMLLVKPLCYLMVSAEVALGLAISVGYFTRGASLLASSLFLIFAIALISVLLRKLPVMDCGCANYLFSVLDFFGLSVSSEPNWKIVFADILLAVLSLGFACSSQRGYGLDSFILREAHTEN